MKVIVIIPAAGLGTRMAQHSDSRGKKNVPTKQFAELSGTPILVHTLRKFTASPNVSEIWIALQENEIASFRVRSDKEDRKSVV